MNTRRLNQLLYTGAALLGAGAAAVLIFGLTLPLDVRAPASPDRAAAPSGANDSALPAMASLEPLWDLRLRGDLGPAHGSEPAPARLAADVAPVASGLPVSLVGTIGESLAILRIDASGGVEVRAAGEELAGVAVLEVRPARVRVRFNGQEHVLRKPVDRAGGT